MEQSHHELKQKAQGQEELKEKSAPNTPATATQPVRHYRAYLFQLYILIAAVAFGALLFLARTTPYFSVDLAITHAIQTIQWQPFSLLMQFLTDLGYAPQSFVLVGVFVAALFLLGLRWESVVLLVSVTGVGIVGTLIKGFVQRARPTSDLVNVFSVINEFSFPSGHVLYYVSFLGFIGFLLFTLAPKSWWRTASIILILFLIATVGVSRVYLGQHWPSDVFGAYLLSSVWLALMIYLYRWGKTRFFVSQPAAPEQPKPSTVTK